MAFNGEVLSLVVPVNFFVSLTYKKPEELATYIKDFTTALVTGDFEPCDNEAVANAKELYDLGLETKKRNVARAKSGGEGKRDKREQRNESVDVI